MLDFITWTVNPEIYSGFVTVRWYGLMWALGFLFGYEMMSRIFKHEGAPEKWVGILFFYVVISVIIGARLGHVFFYDWDYYSQHPAEILKIWEGGLASHGGVAGIIVALFLYSRYVTHRSVLWILDRIVVPCGVVAALIRTGNLFNHEIYGCETSLPWGFRFVDNVHDWMQGAPPVFTPPCHPTQIYEALCYLAMFGVCMWMYWKRNDEERPGLIFGVCMVLVFVSRFLIEYIKNVQEPWELNMRATWGIDMGQLLSIPFVILGVWLIVRAYRRPRLHLDFPNKFPPEDAAGKKR